MSLTYLLKRHPLAMEAHFDFVLVVTYAFPREVLQSCLPPGLEIDTFGDLGFVAVAVVQTRNMRPRGMPKFISRDYGLIGYRIFVRYKTNEGRRLRGLKIMRSDTDHNSMVAVGNLLTHYNFQPAEMHFELGENMLAVQSKSKDGIGDFEAVADLSTALAVSEAGSSSGNHLPEGSPFVDLREALKFAGPMPFTFDYEQETNSIIRVEGVRERWHPQSVQVKVQKLSFFDQAPFNQATPRHCSSFYVKDVPYYWKSAIIEGLDKGGATSQADTERGAE